jgi:hypothetical protein
MTRNVFGWDLPPGVTQRMIDESIGGDEPMDNPVVGYMLIDEDFDKLRKISDFLHSMEKCDADARRDLGHKMWLILNNAVEVNKNDK